MVGWSFIIRAAQSWNLTSTYTELLAKIHNTSQQVRTTSTGPCHARMQVRIASTYIYNYIFLQLVRTIHTSMYPVLSSSQLKTLNLCDLAYVFFCRPKRSMLAYVTAICRRYNPYRLTCSIILTWYVTATLSICTRYYYNVLVIYISSSNSMLSSLSYDTYKPKSPPQWSSISQESVRTR